MTPRETLNQYRQTVQEIRAIQQQLNRLHAPGKPQGLRTQQYTPCPVTNDPASAALQLFEGLERQMTVRQEQLDKLTPAFHAIADSASTPLLTVILYRYYGMGETDDQVAAAVGRSRRRVCQLRRAFFTAQ